MKKLLSALLVGGMVSFSANADMMYTDVNEVGDNKAFIDYETGIEWMNTNDTAYMSYNEVNEALDGQFSGWRWATRDEVSELLYNELRYISTSNYLDDPVDIRGNDENNYQDTKSMIEMFGALHDISAGWLVLNETGTGMDKIGVHANDEHNFSYSMKVLENHPDLDFDYKGYGHFLVSDGGTTLSSRLDPTLNINNPDAPINQASAVSLPFFTGGLALLFIGLRKRRCYRA